MGESKTAKASRVVVQKKEDPFDTPGKKITGLRKLREANLFVNRMDFVDALLESYDRLLKDHERALAAWELERRSNKDQADRDF